MFFVARSKSHPLGRRPDNPVQRPEPVSRVWKDRHKHPEEIICTVPRSGYP